MAVLDAPTIVQVFARCKRFGGTFPADGDLKGIMCLGFSAHKASN